MSPPHIITADLLLQHGGFLKRLARRLLADEQRAEDVVQETYLAALQASPPAHVRPRAWLAGVTKNLALRRLRTERRFRRREEAARRRNDVPPTADVAARLEIHGRLVEAVMALPEPGRTLIVLRFFEDRSPTEISRLQNVPVRTVATRLRRARRRLRADLDRACGGDRMAWCAALIPVADISSVGGGAGSGVGAASSTTVTASTCATGATSTALAAGAIAMSTKMIVALTLACAVGAFAAGWGLSTSARDDDAGTQDASEDARSAEAGAELGSSEMRLEVARRKLSEEQEGHRAARAELKRVKQRLAALEADAPTAPGASVVRRARAPRYDFKGESCCEEALAAVDWDATGEALVKMGPLLKDLVDSAAQRKGLPSSLADLQRWNAPLLKMALEARKRGVPGTGIAGSFSHPSILVNMLYAALQQGGKPLDERQAERVGEIGARYVEKDKRRLAGYDAATFHLQKVLDETALKDGFYAEVHEELTEEQREILHPKRVRGYLGADLFSSATIWNGLCVVYKFESREALAKKLASRIAIHFELADEYAETLATLAQDWVRGFPAGYLDTEPDPVLVGSVLPGSLGLTVDRARTAAVQMLAFLRALHERLPPGSAHAKRIHDQTGFGVPAKWRPKEK